MDKANKSKNKENSPLESPFDACPPHGEMFPVCILATHEFGTTTSPLGYKTGHTNECAPCHDVNEHSSSMALPLPEREIHVMLEALSVGPCSNADTP